MTGLPPGDDSFFDESGFHIMLLEELGLAVHQLEGMSLERFSNLRVQLLARAA